MPQRGCRMRLNKYLAQCGVCSRRDADKLIEQGKVLVNGQIAGMGQQVEETDTVQVGKKILQGKQTCKVLAFYKPVGVVCTERDPHAEKKIMDMIRCPERLTYAGRLDKDSEGLILLTNDGELINAMMRGANRHEKEYIVKIDREITPDFLEIMRKGIYLKDLDITTRECKIEKIGKYTFRIILTQGLNRQIRRMCLYLGYEVLKLKRIRIMNLTLDGIQEGEYREIRPEEWKTLQAMLASSTSETVTGTGGRHGNSGNQANERTGAEAGQSGKSLLSGRYRDYKQQRVRSDVRRASGSGKRNGNRSGKQSHHQRRI